MNGRTLVAVFLLLLAASGGRAEERGATPKLRYNPFARPVVAAPMPPPKAKPAAAAVKRLEQETPLSAKAPEPPPEPPWSPELRGTLVAGPHSLANLGGVILGIGDVLDGRHLREVRAAEAVFEGDDRWFLVRLGGETVSRPAAGPVEPASPNRSGKEGPP